MDGLIQFDSEQRGMLTGSNQQLRVSASASTFGPRIDSFKYRSFRLLCICLSVLNISSVAAYILQPSEQELNHSANRDAPAAWPFYLQGNMAYSQCIL